MWLNDCDLSLTINISLNGRELKKLRRETLAQDVFDEMKFWWGKDTGHNISEIFNFVDLCSRMCIVWSTTTRTRVGDAIAVTFSVTCCDPLKLYRVSGNIFRKWFASYFFICSRVFNNNVISNGKSYLQCREMPSI